MVSEFSYTGEAGYLKLLEDILKYGSKSGDRTGTGTVKVFARQIRFDFKDGFPLLTTKRVWLKGIIHELLWFISGSTNIRPLVLAGVGIWNEWPFQEYLRQKKFEEKFPKYSQKWDRKLNWFIEKIKKDKHFADIWGSIGEQAYGKGWRDFGGVDQLALAIDMIKNNPTSRRILVSAWNPPEIAKMPKASLPPCHYGYQFFVDNNKLSILVNIRSWDVFLGGPFNITSYALLLAMVAQVTNLKPKEVIISSGDTHIYSNHMEAVQTQLSRKNDLYKLPELKLNSKIKNINNFKYEDINVVAYKHHSAIKAQIAV